MELLLKVKPHASQTRQPKQDSTFGNYERLMSMDEVQQGMQEVMQ